MPQSIFKPARSVPRLVAGTVPESYYQWTITGITISGNGAIEPNCTVYLFSADAGNMLLGSTTSDGNGRYTFNPATNSGTFWEVAFSPDGQRAGVTLRTLTAV